MTDNRPTSQQDARLEAARRFGERAKAFAQWRRGGQRADTPRPGPVPGGAGDAPRNAATRRAESRSQP